MAFIDFKNLIHYRGNKVRFLLLASFVVLFLMQIFLGIKELEDFLVVLIFALFMNDFIFKYRHPETLTIAELTDAEKIKRKKMTMLLALVMSMPFVLDFFKVSSGSQTLIYKIALILWAQAFLIDTFLNYRETHSKKWLLFSQAAAMLLLFIAFV